MDRTNIIIAVITSMAITIFTLTVGYVGRGHTIEKLNLEIENKEAKIETCFNQKETLYTAINSQNAQIEQYKIDIKNAQKIIVEETKKIEKKYSKVDNNNNRTCEAILDEIKKIEEAFYGTYN